MNNDKPLDKILPLLKNVKQGGKGWSARCPAHEDKQNSLSVREVDDGKLLVKCFSGCETKEVLRTIGLLMRDLFPQNGRKRRPRLNQTLTVEQLAADKMLPAAFLNELDIVDKTDMFDNPVVRITYKFADGRLAPRQRIRRALRAKQGSLWSKGEGRPIPYGEWRLPDLEQGGDLFVVEGESDCWTLWKHGVAALGLPGATMWKILKAEHVARAGRIYLVQESDDAGEKFVEEVAKRLVELGCAAEILIVRLDGAKDINDLYKKDVEGFPAALEKAKASAVSLEAGVSEELAREALGGPVSGNPERYFGGTEFYPSVLSDDIQAREEFISSPIDDAGKGVRLLYYKEGLFKSGESVARSLAHKMLDFRSKPSRIDGAVALIRESTKMDASGLDPKALELVNVQNGMLKWRTGELLPHHRKYLSTFQINAKYDPGATSPLIDRFLSEVFPQDALDLAEEMLGYLLIPTTRHQKAFMLVGKGANGKSTFLSAVEEVLGRENVSHVALQDMSDNRFAAAELMGKQANIYPDLPAKALERSDVFKAVVTGDVIKAERKFQHPFSLRSHARLLFSANELPPSRDLTAGLFRRWIIIPFPNVFEGNRADRGLAGKLITPEARSAWLNRAVAGLKRLEAQQGFTDCPSVLAATEKYRRQCDNVYEFAEERLRVTQGQTLAKAEAYEAYKTWSTEIGIPHPVSQKTFNKRLSEILAVREGREVAEGGKKLRVWLGLGWAEDAPDRDGPERPGSSHSSSPGNPLDEEAGRVEGEKSEQAGLPGPSRSQELPPELPARIEDWPEHYKDLFEEKAGTFEHEDGFSREEAEKRVESLLRQWYAVDHGKRHD